MTVLANQQKPRIALDTLLARAAPAPRRPAPQRLAHASLSALESASSLNPNGVRPPLLDQPLALVLCVTVATCQSCGSVHRMPGANVLVRYDRAGLQNSTHCRRETLTPQMLGLPRDVKEFTISVPYCEGCF